MARPGEGHIFLGTPTNCILICEPAENNTQTSFNVVLYQNSMADLAQGHKRTCSANPCSCKKTMVAYKELLSIELFVQTLLFGVYLTSLGHCLRWVMYTDQLKFRKNFRWSLFSLALIVFAISMTVLAISLHETLSAISDNTIAYRVFDHVNYNLEGLLMVMTDGILVYRCWMVYSRSWFAITPALLALVPATAIFFAHIGLNAVELETNTSESKSVSMSVGMSYFACLIAASAYATSAIIYRMFKVAGNVNTTRHLFTLWRTVVETGVLYNLISIALFIISAIPADSTTTLVFYALNFCVTIITFNLVLTRIAQHIDPNAQDVNAQVKETSARFSDLESANTGEIIVTDGHLKNRGLIPV